MRTTLPASELLTESQIAQVRKRSDLRGIWLVAHAWLTIIASAALFVWLPNPATFVLAAMVIGSRQLGLLILMHDGAHGLLCRNRRLNDLLSQVFCALPTFADTFIYRGYHLKHHARTLYDDDPDIVLTGHYPITRASLRRKLLRDLSGRTGLSQRRAQFSAAAGRRDEPVAVRLRKFAATLGPHLLVNALLFGTAVAAGHWIVYPLLWLLPLVTWQQLVLRVRNIAEHAVVRGRDDPFGNARTTTANVIERLFVAPYWVNYHLEHHLMMWVPCYRLPLLRRFLLANGYGDRMLGANGYLQVLNEVTVDTQVTGGEGGRKRAMGTFSDGFGA